MMEVPLLLSLSLLDDRLMNLMLLLHGDLLTSRIVMVLVVMHSKELRLLLLPLEPRLLPLLALRWMLPLPPLDKDMQCFW
jgi:hypothetical protein